MSTDRYCNEDELPCDITAPLFAASWLEDIGGGFGIRVYPWPAVVKALESLNEATRNECWKWRDSAFAEKERGDKARAALLQAWPILRSCRADDRDSEEWMEAVVADVADCLGIELPTITPFVFATLCNRSVQSVYRALRARKIPGAIKIGDGRHSSWLIPDTETARNAMLSVKRGVPAKK